MSYVRIMIHAVWGTKNREPYLTTVIRSKVVTHIRDNARSKKIFIDSINGYTDHLHCLLGLDADMTIARVMQLIKGESAYWINKSNLTRHRFEWADEYFAVSVSESMIAKVRGYIRNQEEHHKLTTFTEEYNQFIKKHGFLARE